LVGPFLYDFRRTLTSKTVMIAMAAMILLSLISFPSFIFNAPPTSTPTSQIFAYYDSSGYHFDAFAWNELGQPVSGTRFEVSVTVPALSPSNVTGSAVTNSSGSTQFTIAVPENNGYTLSVAVTAPNLAVTASGTYTPFSSSTPPGQTVSVFRATRFQQPATPTTVIDSVNASARDIFVSWAGPGGSPPVGYRVYYRLLNSNQSCQTDAFIGSCPGVPSAALVPSELNETNSQLLGTMGSYIGIFRGPQLDGNISNASAAVVAIGLTYPNGTSVPGSAGPASSIPVTQLYPSVGVALAVAQDNQVVVSFFDDIFGLFIPLLAIVTTYNTYGKDRISGVLESILAQPVTRKGLALSRYISSFAGMSVAILASAAVLDLIAQHFSQSFVDPTILIFSTVALLVELAAFIGVMMLLSHLVKSSGALIGLGVGLFLVIDFFQGLIVSLLTSMLRIQNGSAGFYQLSVGLDFVNPAQFASLVDTYLTGIYRTAFIGIPTGSFPITPESYGITISAIAITAVLWIAVPLVCFLYLATRRD
jgi:ABC-type transport system involved in multi-copper enzyme maturation permease subunit